MEAIRLYKRSEQESVKYLMDKYFSNEITLKMLSIQIFLLEMVINKNAEMTTTK
jgi:hypothetical protein